MNKSFIFLLLVGLLVTSCSPNTTQHTKVKKGKYNVLFLFADDQRADALGCAGNPYIKTPNIDKLASTGMQFTSAYVMGGHHGAICAPSRAMLMTGKSLFHVYDKMDGKLTMPKYFAQHGYDTFGTGKWHNGANSFEETFQRGENVFIGGMCDHFNVPCRTLKKGEEKLTKPVKKGFSTDLFIDAAKDFISEYGEGGNENPFFCYVAFTAPHDPRSPREDYIGMYKDEETPLPGNFKGLHPFEFDNMNIRDETLAPWPRTPEIIQASIADYYGLVSHVDDRIGDLIDLLKQKGLYDNTIIVYAADNGLAIGSHGLLGKQNMYEHSTRVPFIISGANIPEMSSRDALTYLYDIFPTLCEINDLPIPEGVDGESLLNVINGESNAVRTSIYTVYRNTVRAVRKDEWKYIKYPQRNHIQLFNLKSDPLEINNLADLSECKEKIREMDLLLNEWYEAVDDTATINPNKFLPLEYDHTKLKQIPDVHQPQYVLDRYFKGVDLSKMEKTKH
ncbi:MAG: sulfatase-like hydrolase/transferase [Carboxylicivirga sp.]|jgi:arylsulfatase A-like enzyme|nr:sulfatase-like hydrolase/transferase [Carboxylicivirga sp.]